MEKATFVGKLRAMMRIDIITVLPELLQSPLNYSILKRAQDKKLVEIVVHNLRDYSLDKHRRVDDYPFGGEAGMVMQIEPVDRAITQLKSERNYDEVILQLPTESDSTSLWLTVCRWRVISLFCAVIIKVLITAYGNIS